MDLLWFLVIGGLAGFAAGKLLKGQGFGLFGNIGVGCVGALVGGFLFSLVGLEGAGRIANFVIALVGALVLLWVVGQIKKP
jgi:uncharacterized membrane protein YeaQ/YmgE (transglycosylase-associated protein family)